MKVKELITKLQEFNMDSDVVIFIESKSYIYGAKDIEVFSNISDDIVLKGEDTDDWK